MPVAQAAIDRSSRSVQRFLICSIRIGIPPLSKGAGKKYFHRIAQNNAIWVRLQGTSAGAIKGYVPVDATP
jgi:hypothetical protein